MAIFSFQLNKNITAGEGGLVACDDESLYRRSWAVHDLGYPRNADGRLEFSDPNYQMWGQGSRYAELLAAVMLAQLGKLEKITSADAEQEVCTQETSQRDSLASASAESSIPMATQAHSC